MDTRGVTVPVTEQLVMDSQHRDGAGEPSGVLGLGDSATPATGATGARSDEDVAVTAIRAWSIVP